MKSSIKNGIACVCLLYTQVAHSQNVGIGTTAPRELLHVAGNIRVDTIKANAIKLAPNAGLGKILTSDAIGNASWQPGANIGFGVWGDCATNGNIGEYNPVSPDDGAAADGFGYSVAISGNLAVVGTNLDDVGSNVNQGSVSFYRHDGTSWELIQKVSDATGAASDGFGGSVAIDGNTAVVGTAGNGVAGSASIYQYNGTNWVFVQKITDPTGTAGDQFGTAVSISGTFIIAGSPDDVVGANSSQGSVCIFRYQGAAWAFMQKIVDATGGATAEFGGSVSISGNYAIAASKWEDFTGATDQGSASIYRFNSTNWVLMSKIKDATGLAGDRFGWSVSISGNYAIVGATNDDIGANSSQGSASIYNYNGTAWVLMQKIWDAHGAVSDVFGTSVSISGNYALIGTRFDDVDSSADQGSASLYMRLGNSWQKLQLITDPAGFPGDNLGRAVAIDGVTNRFLASAFLAAPGGKVLFGKVN